MILRMWHGYTAPQGADAYEAMLRETILPGLHRVSGYRGAYVARRNVESEVEFMTLTMWDSMDAVHAFSGNGRAVIHETARSLLTHFDEYSIHYDGTFVP